jgi:hypothetical protein
MIFLLVLPSLLQVVSFDEIPSQPVDVYSKKLAKIILYINLGSIFEVSIG